MQFTLTQMTIYSMTLGMLPLLRLVLILLVEENIFHVEFSQSFMSDKMSNVLCGHNYQQHITYPKSPCHILLITSSNMLERMSKNHFFTVMFKYSLLAV